MSARRPTIASGSPEHPANRIGPRPHSGRGLSSSRPGPAELTASSLRRLERKSRAYRQLLRRQTLPTPWLAGVTAGSFQLESLAIGQEDVLDAVARRPFHHSVRSVQVLRLRNHLAILRGIERLARLRAELTAPSVLRWYTSISCGLSIAAVDSTRTDQLALCLRRLHSSPMRLQQALHEAAALYARLMEDPIFPGFNGVLARLLLQHQLMRSQLPPVVFQREYDSLPLIDPSRFVGRLLELSARACEALTRP